MCISLHHPSLYLRVQAPKDARVPCTQACVQGPPVLGLPKQRRDKSSTITAASVGSFLRLPSSGEQVLGERSHAEPVTVDQWAQNVLCPHVLSLGSCCRDSVGNDSDGG